MILLHGILSLFNHHHLHHHKHHIIAGHGQAMKVEIVLIITDQIILQDVITISSEFAIPVIFSSYSGNYVNCGLKS